MASKRLEGRLVALVVIGVCVLAVPAAATSPGGATVDQSTRRLVAERLDRMPLLFVPEPVSPEGAMGFAVRGLEASIWLSETGIAYRLTRASEPDAEEVAGSWAVVLDLVGATPRTPVGEDPLLTKVSYFKGPKEQWRTGLPSYGSVRYREPWPGIDVIVSGNVGELESTFVVTPGADPGAILLAYRGATAVRLEPDGSLVVDTPLGEIRELAPFAYQEIDGQRVRVAAAFELEDEQGRQAYRFRLGEYDPAHELVIDPVTLVYSGYIGGSSVDHPYGIAVDAAGNTYITGQTYSSEPTFPVTVGPDLTSNGSSDAFVAKVNADGTTLDYCGYIGGSGVERGAGIAVDAAGNAYIMGFTSSTETTFPVTVGPDLTFNGGEVDTFVAKVNAAGTELDYCGYIGGSGGDEYGNGVAVDAGGNAFVAGYTNSSQGSFPVTVGPDLTYNGGSYDAFVAKVNAGGTALDYCGYIGGSGDDSINGIAVDNFGMAYVTGRTNSTEASFPVAVGPDLGSNGGTDAFVAKVNAAGSALDYCGYIGGSGSESGLAIVVDAVGDAFVAGSTSSSEGSFPVTVGPDLTFNGGTWDAFIARIDATGASLDYCGYIGGSGNDRIYYGGIDADNAGNAYITGHTESTEATFPVVVGPDLTYNGGTRDAFVARVDADGTALDYCGYIGGSGDENAYYGAIAVDPIGNAYVTGGTDSTEASFPVSVGPDLTYNGGGADAFVAKVSAFGIFTNGFESGDTSAWSATVP